ncbi:C4-dicarboxylate TRAP transporter substrate-binding protein [Alkalilacustris brevis]|uniref:C4-dicarboxylate TRAP transporter substrate-binding protein n=1 Tax=Alkalilacustris brevis TaxID=2026338 RepID=UPI001EE4942E|nr:C4-dicarboxylate TRAP transporter substrate-binding protein [Alkalilacustris brevis]
MNMRFAKGSMVAAVSALALMAPGINAPAQAQETIRMVVLDGYPSRSMWLQEMSSFFVPRVDELLAETGNYQIQWQESYDGTIVRPRGVLEGIKLGLGDLGVVTTPFKPSALPSQGLAAVTPFITSDARVVARVIDEIADEIPQMRAEFEAENQVYLATGVVLDTYQLFTRDPVTSLEDVEGLRIAASGFNLRYIEGIEGTAGVVGGLPDFYNHVQTNLTEGAILWPEAAITYSMYEVAPYMLNVDFGSVSTKAITINADYWNNLPEEVQEVIQQAAIEYRDRLADVAMDLAAESIATFIENGGTVTDLSHDDRVAWANSMPNIAMEWATELDDEGAPGSEMLRAYIQKLRDAGFEPLRDWAAELPS